MIESKTLVGALLIVIISLVAGYALGQFSAPAEQMVTTTSSTTITEIQTKTTTSTWKITETTTSTTTVVIDLQIPSPANSTTVIRMFYLFDGRVLATLSIDKPSYSQGETVHIKGTLTNITPDDLTLRLNYYAINIRNSSHYVWAYPEHMFVRGIGPGPPEIQLTLSPSETKTGGEWSTADWNMTGLHTVKTRYPGYTSIRTVYDDHYLPEDQYTLVWNLTLRLNGQEETLSETIPFTITG